MECITGFSPRGKTEKPQNLRPENLNLFRGKILNWYRQNRRTLPWRKNPTPYRVWISEIMLQQTQSGTAIPYYERFLERFPDIASLAGASEEEVLSLWSGLGYYSRARNIHKAARRIMQTHKGRFPTDFNTIISLPGIGRYTAGAICSIALNQPYPVVDGNIRRVISRLKGIRKKIPEKYFWGCMTAWLPEKYASDFNQAMMELGAVICLPSQPLCPKCPAASFCRAKKLNFQEKIPPPRTGKPATKVDMVVLVLQQKEKVLLVNQMDTLIPGKWGLPCRRISGDRSPSGSARQLNRILCGDTAAVEYCGTIRHSIMHYRITAHIYRRNIEELPVGIDGGATSIYWAGPGGLRAGITSSIFRKALVSAGWN